LLEQRLKELVAQFDDDVERVDGGELTPEKLPDLLAGVTLFSSKRLIILKNTSSNKAVWVTLGEWLEKGIDNNVIVVEPNPDKRTKTYRWLEKHAEMFAAKELQPREALAWVQQKAKQLKLDMSVPIAQFFVDYIGTDQWRLASELEKLALSQKTISEDLICELIEPTPQATSFELLDAAFAGQHDRLERLLATVARQEDPYMFFGLLSGQVYAVALMKTAGHNQPDVIAKATGVHPFVLRKVSSLARNLSLAEVKRMIAELAELDANMKLRPTEPWTQIQAMLLRLTS